MNLTITLNPNEYDNEELLDRMMETRITCGYATTFNGGRVACTCEGVRASSQIRLFGENKIKIGPCDSTLCPALD